MTEANDRQPVRVRASTAQEFGRRSAAKLFEGRKGHGGGPCSYRTLRPPELAAILAAAFEAGVRYAATRPAGPVPAAEDQSAAANIG